MDCSTIIVSYNTFALTEVAVRSALASAASLQHEVIVVDNSSPDDSARRLRDAFPKAEYPNVDIVASSENLGFSRGNNIGARRAKGRVLFFLNPDTVVHDNAIPHLCAYLDAHPEAGAVGPRVINTDGTDQLSTAPFSTALTLLRYYFPVRPLRPRPPLVPQPVDIVNGCALALRRDAFDHVGGWDERYFMYAEENELCLALHRAGYTNVFLPGAVITHHGGSSSLEQYAEQQVIAHRSVLKFLRRHCPPAVVYLNRMAGVIGFGMRATAFSVLAYVRPSRAAEYRLRGDAASTIWRWFLFSYD